MKLLTTLFQIIKGVLLFMFAPVLMFVVYAWQVYNSVYIMTFKGYYPKRHQKSYYDIGFLTYKEPETPNKKFETQVLGAIVFFPATIFLIGLIFGIVGYLTQGNKH